MIYLILPAYNEADGILELLREIAEERGQFQDALLAVVVDDGSTDGTADLVESVVRPGSVVLLRHARNQGLRQALDTGIQYVLQAGKPGDLVGAMDADLTHDPKYLREMAEVMAQGKDVVIASRFARGGHEVGVSLHRHILSRGASLTYRLFAPWIRVHDVSCGYRLLRWELLALARQQWGERLMEASGFACTGELLIKVAALTTPDKIAEIPFTLRYDAKRGPSKMPTWKTIAGTLRMLIGLRKTLRGMRRGQ